MKPIYSFIFVRSMQSISSNRKWIKELIDVFHKWQNSVSEFSCYETIKILLNYENTLINSEIFTIQNVLCSLCMFSEYVLSNRGIPVNDVMSVLICSFYWILWNLYILNFNQKWRNNLNVIIKNQSSIVSECWAAYTASRNEAKCLIHQFLPKNVWSIWTGFS